MIASASNAARCPGTTANKKTHCWHVAGKIDRKKHGPHARNMPHYGMTDVYKCCHCAVFADSYGTAVKPGELQDTGIANPA